MALEAVIRMQRSSGTLPDPIYRAADLLDDAWSWMIMREAIFGGVTRFGVFETRLGIAPKVLSARLSRLAEGGLFAKRRLESGGAVREYRLTAMGEDFVGCLCAAWRWGALWRESPPPPCPVHHRVGGHPLKTAFTCAACGEPVRARDVEVRSMRRDSANLVGDARRRRPDLDRLDNSGCPIAYTLRAIGDRWSSLLIREAFLGVRRFGDYESRLGIASNILADRLSHLVDLGVMATSKDRRGEYRLTERGHDLYWVPLAILTWSERWLTGGAATTLHHKTCGRDLHAVFTCAECGDPVGYDDLVFERSVSK